ncbi:MAG: YceD family protein [Rhodanobacter sp.]
MSVTLPESVDAWRMVSARRSFEGTLPIASLRRLGEALAGTDGEVSFALDFGRDDLGTSYVDVRASAPLTLICQRSLEPFVLPVAVQTRLGLISQERDEAGLPPDCEPLLVAEDGRLHPADVIEDELLLALPLVPVNPESRLPDEVTGHDPAQDPAGAGRAENPFAVLRELKK